MRPALRQILSAEEEEKQEEEEEEEEASLSKHRFSQSVCRS
jgi:hypothetical protein